MTLACVKSAYNQSICWKWKLELNHEWSERRNLEVKKSQGSEEGGNREQGPETSNNRIRAVATGGSVSLRSGRPRRHLLWWKQKQGPTCVSGVSVRRYLPLREASGSSGMNQREP